MSLAIGTRLGAYEILSALGAGGMGEVYRARDTRLDRDVAIKILPHVFFNDAERVARFQREAKVLGSLNHPHIAAIYGLHDDADGVRAPSWNWSKARTSGSGWRAVPFLSTRRCR